MPNESYLTYTKDGQASSFVGRDAVELFRAAALASALGLYAKTGMTHSRVKLADMLALATKYTGKSYRRTRPGAAQAKEDVTIFVRELKAALPVREG